MSSSVNFICSILLIIVLSLDCADSYPQIAQTNTTKKVTVGDSQYKDVFHLWHHSHSKRRLFYIPFARPYKDVFLSNSSDHSSRCPGNDSNFPAFLSDEQVLHGGIVLVILIGAYGFSLLAVVCNNYFLPCVEIICEKFNLTPDVAAATFMSIATSTPEFFTNIVGTFVTKSDLGIGTIVGSSLCNALLVPAIGGLNSPFPLELDWYPLTRDCIIYVISVSVLIVITWDGDIYWYETLIPLTVYVCYFIVMFNNKRIAKLIKNRINKNKVIITPRESSDSIKNNNNNTYTNDVANDDIKRTSEIYTNGMVNVNKDGVNGSIKMNEDVKKLSEIHIKRLSEVDAKKNSAKSSIRTISQSLDDIPKQSIMSAYGSYLKEPDDPEFEIEHRKVLEAIKQEERIEAKKSIFRRPEGNCFKKFLFYYTWPIKLILKCTIPSPKVNPNWFVVTFLMCIVWIGINSYLVSWMISIIGDITNLPDSLLGMTLMAVGGCLPETVSMTIIARRGEGAFGVSNSLGANTMNVLYSLGLPWFFKNLINGFSSANPVRIQSGTIEYTIMSLIVAVSCLYITMLIGKFRLSKISGGVLGFFYTCLVALAIISQTVLFESVEC